LFNQLVATYSGRSTGEHDDGNVVLVGAIGRRVDLLVLGELGAVVDDVVEWNNLDALRKSCTNIKINLAPGLTP
jgi:hypothetical protein